MFNLNEQDIDIPFINNISISNVLKILKVQHNLYHASDYKHFWIVTDLHKYKRQIIKLFKNERYRKNRQYKIVPFAIFVVFQTWFTKTRS
jgi:hypothetical protein